jgi:hydroxymethylbilane synthase
VKSRVLTFGSLDSPLARNLTQTVIDEIQARMPRLTCQMNIWPSGVQDKELEPFVAASRGEVEFLEEQVMAEQARLIVLEAADMVLPLPADLAIVCVPDRAAPFDAYLNRQGMIMDEMDPGSRIGVLSMRSRSQMQAQWPEISFRILRGGVDLAMETHMRRNEIDGLVLPAAVTEHLGIQGIVAEIFAPEFILPGPGQGILVVVGRAADQEARELLAPLHSEATATELQAEHAFCSRMISDQDLPVGALARVLGEEIVIEGATGSGINRIFVNGGIDEAEAVGSGLAQQILSCGESFADLLEADFPDGLPEDTDEDSNGLEPDLDLAAATGNDADRSHLDEDLEDLKALENLAGIAEEADDAADEDDDTGHFPYDS